jgi:MFS family permease
MSRPNMIDLPGKRVASAASEQRRHSIGFRAGHDAPLLTYTHGLFLGQVSAGELAAAPVMLYLVALLTVLLHLAFAGARVTLSLFALELGASAATVGVLVALLALVPMFFALKWGRYVDRVGVRGPMYIGVMGRCTSASLRCSLRSRSPGSFHSSTRCSS